MAATLASVLITNYNYGAYLSQCVRSALAQSYGALEIVVVDDGSTDDSRARLREFGDRITLVEQQNAGQAAAFAAGLPHCKGEIICLLDADDYWHAEKVQRVMETFKSKPQVAWLRHKLVMVNEAGRPMHVHLPQFGRSRIEGADRAAVAERVITAPTSALVLRRDLAREVLTADRMRYDADALVLARCVAAGARGYSLNELLGSYRRHSGQQYNSNADLRRMLERQIEVGSGVARVLGRPQPVSNYKQRLITQTLSGKMLLHPRRLATAFAGALSSLHLLGRPKLFARQCGGLLLAAGAPHWWLQRIRKLGDYH